MEALEREADGRPFNEAARNKFAGLATTRTEIGKRLKELRLRHATPTGSGRDPARNESMDDVYYPSDRGNGARRPDEPRHIAEGREAGLRAIDGQAGILTARAGDRLERAVRRPQRRRRSLPRSRREPCLQLGVREDALRFAERPPPLLSSRGRGVRIVGQREASRRRLPPASG